MENNFLDMLARNPRGWGGSADRKAGNSASFWDDGGEVSPMSIDESNRHQRNARDQNAKGKNSAVLTEAPDTVWPSPLWWESHGVTSPDILDRYGKTQAALLGLINGIGLGLPKPIMSALAPEASKTTDGILSAHKEANSVGELAGFLASPANIAYRAVGDTALAAGYGTKTAAAADALSAAALQTAPSLIDGDGLDHRTGTVSGVASMSRWLSPHLPNSLLGRSQMGLLAGATTSLPAMHASGNPWSGVDPLLTGLIYGASSRGRAVDRGSPRGHDGIGTFANVATLYGGLDMASRAHGAINEVRNAPTKTFGWPDSPRTPEPANEFLDWLDGVF